MLFSFCLLICEILNLVKERIHKGIPDCLRILVWPKLTEIERFKLSENLKFHVLNLFHEIIL